VIGIVSYHSAKFPNNVKTKRLKGLQF